MYIWKFIINIIIIFLKIFLLVIIVSILVLIGLLFLLVVLLVFFFLLGLKIFIIRTVISHFLVVVSYFLWNNCRLIAVLDIRSSDNLSLLLRLGLNIVNSIWSVSRFVSSDFNSSSLLVSSPFCCILRISVVIEIGIRSSYDCTLNNSVIVTLSLISGWLFILTFVIVCHIRSLSLLISLVAWIV